MSDTRFHGKRLHPINGPKLPRYDVHGHQIYESPGKKGPVFEIRDNYIYPIDGVRPVFDIRKGRYVHEYMSASAPMYEFL